MALTRRRRQSVPGLLSFELHDFSGGLNLRDEATEVAPNESPDMMNVTLDERGAVVKRLGYADDGTMAAEAADISNLIYSDFIQNLVMQAGALIRKRTGAGTFATIDTRTTSARVAFSDFTWNNAGTPTRRLFYIHPVDGVFRNDGTTATNVSTAVKGDVLASWQNKLWAAGDPANPTRIYFSNAGDGATWTTATDFVDLREKDDTKITAMWPTRNGLLVFKGRSTYRITDSATGANTMLDANAGAAGPLSVAEMAGTVCVISELGVFITDGLSPLLPASEQLEPLFTPTQLNLAKLDSFCAGAFRDRLVFSFTRTGKTRNDLTLEYSPTAGWFTVHSFGASAFAQFHKDDNTLYHASSGAARRIYRTFSGGSDQEDSTGARAATTAIAARFQSPWLRPGEDYLCRFRRLRLTGRGIFDLAVRRDYELADSDVYSISLLSTTAHFDSGDFYDSGEVYGPSALHYFTDIWSLGLARALSFVITETGTGTHTDPALLGDGTAETAGSVGLYGLKIDFIPLRYA